MKQGWQIVKLRDVCDIISGRNQKAVECPDGKYPIYGSGGVMGYASDYLCESGTTIVGRKGSINNPLFVQERFWNVDTAFGMSPKSTMNKKLFYYFCLSFDFSKMNKGTTIPSLVKSDLLEIDVPFIPSLTEQQRLVEVLDAEFEKIDALKANAECNLQHAKDLFECSLQEVYASHPEWKWDTIGNLCKTGAGGTPSKLHKEYYEGGTIPWLRSGEVCQKYINETEMFITEKGFENSSAHWFPEGTVLVAMYGATAGQVGILKLKATTNQAVCGIFPNERFVPEFLYYSLLRAQKELVAKATGNAQPNISQIKVKGTAVPVLTVEEQTAVIAHLDNLNDRCKTLQANCEKTVTLCDDLKQSLLRKAFSGEL